jgi:hypothetical protein
LQAAAQAGVGSWRRIQARDELGVGLRADGEHRPVQQGILGGVTRSVEEEVRPVLTQQLCRAVDQPTQLRLDPQV